ncbi:MAG: cold-shock protein [Acidimicrobiia bacterium]|nr:cold-shock protein [Acidimicrobiia bacterium]
MPTGTVKFFNDEKGFGFISRDGDSDVFSYLFAGEREAERCPASRQPMTLTLCASTPLRP